MKKTFFTTFVALFFLLAIGSTFAANRVNFEIRNRVASGSTYSVDVWATIPSGNNWEVGSCNLYMTLNPNALDITGFSIDTMTAYNSMFFSNGYSKPWKYSVPGNPSLLEIAWIAPTFGPFANKTSDFYMFTVTIPIKDDTQMDSLKFDETSNDIWNNNNLPLDYNCGDQSCYGFTNPAPRRIRDANTITTNAINGSPFCVNTVLNVPFTEIGTFNAGNVFTAQLSNANGSFANPTTIGTMTSTTAGTINSTIPVNCAQGTGYRIRVIGSNPTTIGTDNGSNITINTLPTAYSLPTQLFYCLGSNGSTITLPNSENGTSYQLFKNNTAEGTPIVGTGSSILWNNKTDGTYTITATKNGCSINMTNSIVVQQYTAAQHFAFTASAASYCSGADGVTLTLSGSENQLNYTLFKNGVQSGTPIVGNGSAIHWNNESEGNYTVNISNPNTGCSITYNDTLKIHSIALPTAFALNGNSSVCSGGSSTLNLPGSEVGVNYQLQKDNVNAQSAQAGAGSPLIWTITESGAYRVIATNSNSCSKIMNDTVHVQFNAAPQHFALSSSASSYCSNSNGVDIILAGSEPSFSYSIYKNNVPFGVILNGTGSSLSWSNAKAGNYTLKVTDLLGGCPVYFNDTVKVTEDAAPLAFNFTGTTSICAGDSAVLRLEGSQLNMAYELFKDNQPYQGPVFGTGNELTWTVGESGIYKVAAGISMTCYTKMNGNDTITVNPRPNQYSISGGGEYCPNDNIQITVSNSDIGVNYTLYKQQVYSEDHSINSAQPMGMVQGHLSPITFNIYEPGYYYVIATDSNTRCSTDLGSALIQFKPVPNKYNFSSNVESICLNSDFTLTLSGSELNKTYRLYENNEYKPGFDLLGTSNSIEWTLSEAGYYYVEAVDNINGCSIFMNDSVLVAPLSTPGAYINGANDVIITSTTTYSNDNGDGTYLWSVTGGTIVGNNNDKTVNIHWETLGNGSVDLIRTIGTCTVEINYSVYVNDYYVPSIQARNIIFTNIQPNQLTSYWTRGNGDSVIVLASQGASVAIPNQGTIYNANSVFGNGDLVGDSTYVVYKGVGRNVTITGLTASTDYTFKVLEYYEGGFYDLDATSSNPRTRTTSLLPPYELGLVSEFSRNQEGADLAWQYQGTVDYFDLEIATDSQFSNIVWDGDVGEETIASVTTLSPETMYYARVKAFKNYSSSTWSNTFPFVTLTQMPDSVTLYKTNVVRTDTSIYFSWTTNKPAKILVLMKQRVNLQKKKNLFDLRYGEEYIANSNFSKAQAYGHDSTKAVLLDSANEVNITGLTPESRYYVGFYAVSGSGATTNYTNMLSGGSVTTLATAPTVPPSNLIASEIFDSSFDISWNNDSTNSTIVLMNTNPDITDTLIAGHGYDVGDILENGSVVVSINNVNYGDTTNSAHVEGLNPETTYFLRAYSFKGYDYYNYLMSPYASTSATTLATEPTDAISTLHISDITASSFNLDYTLGATATKVLVLANTEDTFGEPVDGQEYEFNSDYNNAPTINGGGKIIYSGSNLTTTFTNLVNNTLYHVRIYEYNGTDITANYMLNPYAYTTCTTLQAGPSISPSDVQLTNLSETQTSFKWTRGNGATSLVLVGTTNGTGEPVNGSSYSANNDYTNTGSSTIGDFKAVYSGTDSIVSVSNLALSSNYIIKVYTFDGTGTTTLYNSHAATLGFATMSSEPTTAPTNISAVATSAHSVNLNWTAAGTGTIVLASTSKAFLSNPLDGTQYIASSDYTNANSSVIGNAKTVVFSTSDHNSTITGLQANTKYYFAHYSFNGSNIRINYNEQAAIDSATTWMEAPTVTPSNITFTNVNFTTATINWTKGNGSKHIVVLKAGSAETAVPTNGTNYVANSNFNLNTSSLIGQAKVICNADVDHVDVTGLASGVTYYATVYTFNGDDNQEMYNTSGLTGHFTTNSSVSNLAFSSKPNIITPNHIFTLVVETRNASGVPTNPINPVSVTLQLTTGNGIIVGTVNATIPTSESSFTFSNLVYQPSGIENGIEITAIDNSHNLASTATGLIPLSVVAPTIQDKIIYFTNVTPTSMTVNWSAGNGTSRLLVASQSAPLNTLPSDGTLYTSNLNFGSGSTIGNGYAIYNGTDHVAAVTGLISGQPYHFRVFGYNGIDTTIKYNTSTATFNPKNRFMPKAGMEIPDETGNVNDMLPSNFNMTQILPNPVVNNIGFKLNNLTEQELSIAVYDVSGRMIVNYQNAKFMAIGSYNINIPLENISAGTYLLQIYNGQEVAVQKFVVMP